MLTPDEWADLATALAAVTHAEERFADVGDTERETLAAGARVFLDDLVHAEPPPPVLRAIDGA